MDWSPPLQFPFFFVTPHGYHTLLLNSNKTNSESLLFNLKTRSSPPEPNFLTLRFQLLRSFCANRAFSSPLFLFPLRCWCFFFFPRVANFCPNHVLKFARPTLDGLQPLGFSPVFVFGTVSSFFQTSWQLEVPTCLSIFFKKDRPFFITAQFLGGLDLRTVFG